MKNISETKEMSVVKCPNCKCDTIKILITSEHAVQFMCRNIKCNKMFCKEYK